MPVKTRIVVLLSFLFLSFCSIAQNASEDLSKVAYIELDSFMMLEYGKGNYTAAIPFMEEGAKRAQTEFGTEDSIYANYIGNLAVLYELTSQLKKAEGLHLESLRINKITNGEHSEDYSTALNNLAGLYNKTGRYEEAIELMTQSCEIKRKLSGEKDYSYGNSLNNLAYVYDLAERYEESEPIYLKALDIIANSIGKENAKYPRALHNLAFMYSKIGKYEEAELLYTEAKDIYKKIIGEEHPHYAYALNNLAVVYEKLEQFKNAEPLYLQALAIREKLTGKTQPKYALGLSNLGNLYHKMGQMEKAIRYHEECLLIRKKTLGVRHPSYAKSLSNLAVINKELGNHEKTTAFLYEALDILASSVGTKHSSYFNALENIAKMYLVRNELDLAYSYSMASIAFNATDFNSHFPDLFQNSQKAHFDSSQCCAELNSEDFLKLSSLTYTNLVEVSSSIHALLAITKAQYGALLKLGNKDGAQKKLMAHYNISKAAMLLNEQIRNNFTAKKNKLRILNENEGFVNYGIEAALNLKEDQYLSEAFGFAEQNKSMLLADALKGSRARILGDLPDSLALKEQRLQKEKDDIKKKKYEARDDASKQALIAKENETNLEIEALLKVIKNKYPKYHALKYENITAKVTDVQALLDEKTMLIEYFITDSVSYLFAIQKNKLQLVPIYSSKKELGKKIKALRKSLSDYAFIVEKENEAFDLYASTAHSMYKLLLAPVLKETSVENLILITDGELGHLPFEAFLTKNAGQDENKYTSLSYLMNDYKISYNYSATLFVDAVRSQGREKKSANNNHKMLAYAAAYNPKDSAYFNLRSSSNIKLRKILNPLPEALKEVETLSEVFEGDFFYKYSGFNDSKMEEESANKKEVNGEAFFKENAHQYGVIHLAMHGVLHPRVPMLSSLAFTENGDSLEDNFLQAYEISHLHLNADLVVLSACETGFGKFEQGEGVISLARSFMYAGTPSLVVSLWQVNDYSTAIIMKGFYKYLAQGMSKDGALRQAKLDYIQLAKGIAGHPAFWSAFIQLGDSRPIVLEQKGNSSLWIVLVGGLAVLLIGGGLMKRKQQRAS